MKIRFGVSLGIDTAANRLPAVIDRLEADGVDSLWFSELVSSPAVDPFAGMGYALGRSTRLKVGTSVGVLPGRHPVLVAKQLASLAILGPNRVLPVFGLRPASRAEWDLFPVPDGQRAAVFDEAPAAFRRIGRLADGWLGSFLTPDEARNARESIERAAAENGRQIEPDHYGLSLGVGDGALPEQVLTAVRSKRPDADPTDLVAADWPQLHRQLDGLIAPGLTKFVIRPVGSAPVEEFIDRFVAELLPRQS